MWKKNKLTKKSFPSSIRGKVAEKEQTEEKKSFHSGIRGKVAETEQTRKKFVSVRHKRQSYLTLPLMPEHPPIFALMLEPFD